MHQKQILKFVYFLGKMKQLKRQGWINREIRQPESDAEHSFSTAMLALFLAPAHLDKMKCVGMALVHDLPEVICGDHVPGELSAQEKAELEFQAMQKIVRETGLSELNDWFVEFEQGLSEEAKFVKALDGLDNVLTAKFYEQQ